MFAKIKQNVARIAVVGLMLAVPGGVVTATAIASEPTTSETKTNQAWMIPLPGWWSGKVMCMAFNMPECPNYQPGPMA